MITLSTTFIVRFEHCDPAGIVFYPRYFLMINGTIERWLEQVIGTPFGLLHQQRRLGIPTVHVVTDFPAASRLDDVFDFTLSISNLGTRSFSLMIEAHCGNETRLQMQQKLVFVKLDATPLQSTPIPANRHYR